MRRLTMLLAGSLCGALVGAGAAVGAAQAAMVRTRMTSNAPNTNIRFMIFSSSRETETAECEGTLKSVEFLVW